MEITVNIFAVIVGSLLVYQYSRKFFDSKGYYLEDPHDNEGANYFSQNFIRPIYPKYLVDRRKYQLWSHTFLGFNFILYLVISFVFYKFKPDLSGFNFSQLQKFLYGAYPQILGALVITGFLPSLPERIHIQNIFREFAQGRANIPDLARDYYRNLKRNGLDISDTDIETTIAHFSEDVVQPADFKFRDHAPEKLWAYTCYLYLKIKELSSVANSPYSKNISKKELAFANFQKNFRAIKRKLQTENGRKFEEPAISMISSIFSQVSQIIICLIFCSEPNDRSAISQFKKIGLKVHCKYTYKIRFDLLIPISQILFLSVLILPMMLDGIIQILGYRAPEHISGQWLYRASIAAVFIIYFPVLIAHVAKYRFIQKWPVRTTFSSFQMAAPSILFFVGLIWGVFSFLLLDKIFPTMFDEGVQESIGFSLLSGLTCSITACCIDKKPALWELRRTVLQSLYFSLLCFVLFFVFSLIAIVIGNKGVDAATISEVRFWQVNLFILLLAGILGLIIGFVVFFSSAYSKKIEHKAGILNLNINHYLVPLVENRDREVGFPEVRNIIDSQKLAFPKRLVGFFSDHKIFDDEGNLSERGFLELKKLAFAA